jgi:hypothetical protein
MNILFPISNTLSLFLFFLYVVATDSFLNSKIVQVENGDGDGEEEGSYPSLSQGSDIAHNGNSQKQAGGGGRGEGEEEEDVYTQSEGVRKLRKCPEAVDAFKVLWTVSKSAAQHDMGMYCTAMYRTVLTMRTSYVPFIHSAVLSTVHSSLILLILLLVPYLLIFPYYRYSTIRSTFQLFLSPTLVFVLSLLF